jgi:hypothetical protein
MVLTENTPQIASGKKDGAGTLCTADTGFFTIMRSRPDDTRIYTATTQSRTFRIVSNGMT